MLVSDLSKNGLTMYRWMIDQPLDEYMDYDTGEVSATALAEACALESGLAILDDTALDDDTHEVWDAAFLAADLMQEELCSRSAGGK